MREWQGCGSDDLVVEKLRGREIEGPEGWVNFTTLLVIQLLGRSGPALWGLSLSLLPDSCREAHRTTSVPHPGERNQITGIVSPGGPSKKLAWEGPMRVLLTGWGCFTRSKRFGNPKAAPEA